MKILFSNPLELGRTGAGRPYGYLADYLLNKQTNHEVKFISGVKLVQELYGATAPPESLEHGSLSDLLASFEDLSCHVFLGAGCASLSQIKQLHAQDLYPEHHYPTEEPRQHVHAVKTITTWFSTHYQNASRVLTEEYQRLGVQGQAIDPFLIWRDVWEHKWSDALIVPSEACKETYEADPVCKGKVYVAGFGVDSETFHPSSTEPTDFRVLFAGGNWIRKGLHYLIKAWNELRLQAVLTIMGTQPNTSNLWRTNVVGWVPDEQVPEYYRRHTVFCLPTLEEGQALAVLEAMASGLPVITTRESGAPIEDGKEGLIVPARDVEKLKEAIQYLYNNPSEVKRMGISARKRAEELTWSRFGEGVLRVCEEVSTK